MVVCANALLSVLSDEHRIKKVDTAFLFYDFIIVDFIISGIIWGSLVSCSDRHRRICISMHEQICLQEAKYTKSDLLLC